MRCAFRDRAAVLSFRAKRAWRSFTLCLPQVNRPFLGAICVLCYLEDLLTGI